MRIVVDSSTLISLAWAGQLELLAHAPVPLVVPTEVQEETVAAGLARGHPDAAAIEQAIKTVPGSVVPAGSDIARPASVDQAVLEISRHQGGLLTNDLALGRRAANLGIRWLRTADLVVLCVRAGAIGTDRGAAALAALHSAGRITSDLLDAYLEDLP